MTDYFEIDFLDVEAKKSGDAIAMRYSANGAVAVHVVDAGFQDVGERVVAHIREHFGAGTSVDHVVVTHPDGDHAGGLRAVLKSLPVGTLWMLRPWLYATELLPQFARYRSVESLQSRLRDIYPNIAALEEIAAERRILIREPFQGARIGAFTVLAPTKTRYLNLVVSSERTPESVAAAAVPGTSLAALLEKAAARASAFVRRLWGHETFSDEETSAENEMSVVQYASLAGQRILLTGDAGRGALAEAAAYAPRVGLALPGIDRFQVPHHGSRRNVSTTLLDTWLGTRLPSKPAQGHFTALISSAKADVDHPRKAVVRALIHRGANVITTEGKSVLTQQNAPNREGWVAVAPEDYPEVEEA